MGTLAESPAFRHRQVPVPGGEIHVVERGDPEKPTIVFLHGWPQTWRSFAPVMELLSEEAHLVAMDIPGVGGSVVADPPGDKAGIAAIVHRVIGELGLVRPVLAGHDIGGQTAFSYVAAYPDELAGMVMMDMGVPGIDPWNDIITHPRVWHLAFHRVPDLPEAMVSGRIRTYFDHFYQAVVAHPERITAADRAAYVAAYSPPAALSAGFGWYRAFEHDAAVNAAVAAAGIRTATPVLYLRGDKTGGDMARFVAGFRNAGLADIEGVVIPDCGHFAPDEQPEAVAGTLAGFLGRCGGATPPPTPSPLR